jgi:hypothetical protein
MNYAARAYAQNQNLSKRLIYSIIEYLKDQLNDKLNQSQKLQSRAAALTLLEIAVVYINDELPSEAHTSVNLIFAKTVHDLGKNDIFSIKKDLVAFQNILEIV